MSENILPDWTTLCVENVGVEENFQLGWRKWCCPLNGFLVIFVGIQELFTSYKYASQLKEVLEDLGVGVELDERKEPNIPMSFLDLLREKFLILKFLT